MNISIKPNHSLNFIKSEFEKRYPFLKLEFFTEFSDQVEDACFRKILSSNDVAGHICGYYHESFIITSKHTARDMEELFKENFCLEAQVFRKQKENWIETKRTDFLSLETLNEMGRLSDLQHSMTKNGSVNSK
jgi:hypothetical protein